MAFSHARISQRAVGPARQVCSIDNFFDTNFYCPLDGMCHPWQERCSGSSTCLNPQTSAQDGCFEASGEGQYQIRVGHAFISSSSSSSRKKGLFDPILALFKYDLEHQFIMYRGFSYEFGKFYPLQILDINDPDYKYINDREINKRGIETIGPSYCSREDASMFLTMWRSSRYKVNGNNCQDFAQAFAVFLSGSGGCNQPPSSRKKRQADDDDLGAYIDSILTDCSIVCCYSSSSPTAASVVTMVLSAIAFVLITI